MMFDEEAVALGAELPERIIKYFGEAMKQEREAQQMTVEQLASAIEEDVETIKLLESGEVDKMNQVPADVLFYVANALKIDIAELFIAIRRKAMEELKA